MAGKNLGRSFAGEVDHSQLAALDIIVPTADIGENRMLAFTINGLESEEDVMTSGFSPVDAEALESYTGANVVHVRSLSPTGIEQYQLGVVRGMIEVLPYETVEKLIPDGTDIVEAERILRGAINPEQAADLLIESDLLSEFADYRADAFTSADGAVLDPNAPGHTELLDRIELLHVQGDIARDLGSVASDFKSQFDEVGQAVGMSPEKIQQINSILDGTAPEQAPLPGSDLK